MEAQDLARAQKKCTREQRLIVFIDESGLSERPKRVRTWAPKGQTPVIQFHFNWKHVSAIAGLSYHNCLFRLYDGAAQAPCPGQLLPTLARRSQNDRPQSAAQRTATRQHDRRVLEAGRVVVMSAFMQVSISAPRACM